MSIERSSGLVVVSIAVALLGLAAPVGATTVMDQIGDPADIDMDHRYGTIDYVSDDYDDCAVIDDFVVSAPGVLTQVDAVMWQQNPGDYLGVTHWRVEIYSSAAAAGANLEGDVARTIVVPGDVVFTADVVPSSLDNFLVEIPVCLALPDPGTYWIGVIPRKDVALSHGFAVPNLPAGGNPGNKNGTLAYPGHGVYEYPYDFAYRVEATAGVIPEPLTVVGLVMGLSTVTAYLRRRMG